MECVGYFLLGLVFHLRTSRLMAGASLRFQPILYYGTPSGCSVSGVPKMLRADLRDSLLSISDHGKAAVVVTFVPPESVSCLVYI